MSLWTVVFTSYVGGGTGYGLMFADIYHRHLRPSDAFTRPSSHQGASYLPAYRFLIVYTFVSPLYSLFFDWSPIGLVLVQSAASLLTLPLARIDHRFENEGDFGRPERFSESFAIDPVQVE